MALDAGSAVARLGAIFEDRGFRSWDRAKDKTEREAKKPVNAQLGAEVEQKGFRGFAGELAKARAQAKRPVNVEMGARIDSSGFREWWREVRRARAAAARPIVQHIKTRVDTSSVAGARKSLGGLNGAVTKTNSGFQLLRNGMRLVKWPLLVTGAGIATQALSAATAGAAGLLGALGPLSGALAAVPAFAGAAAQGMGVWKLATGGITTALGGLNDKLADTKAQKAAFKGLSDEAKDFARELEKMKPKILGLTHVAQKGLIPGLREGLREAAKNFPVIERLVDRTAKALGNMAAKAGKALGSAEWGRDIETIGTRNVGIMLKLGDAAGNVANALRHVAVASGPAMEGLAKDVVGLTEKLEKAAAAGRKSGRLGAFFDRARERAHKVGKILGNVAGGLLRILTLGNKHMGGPLLDDLEKVSKRFNEWTKSARGQNSIEKYFKRALPGVRELGRTLAEVGKAFLRMGSAPGLAKTLATIRTRLIPAVEKLLTTMANVAGPDVVNALASLADLFAAIAPHVGFVMRVVAKLVGGLADLIRTAPGVGAVVAVMLGLGAAVKAIKFVGAITGLKFLASLAGKAAKAVGPVAGAIRALGRIKLPRIDLGKIFRGGGAGFLGKLGIVGAIADELRRAMPIALREGTKIGNAFKRGIGPGIKQTAKSVWEIFKRLPPVRPFVTAASNAFKTVKGIFGKKIVARLGAAGSGAVREARSTARAIGKWISRRFKATLGALDRTGRTVRAALGRGLAFGRKVFKAALSALDRTGRTVRAALGRGLAFGRKVFKATLAVLDRVTRPVRTAIGKVAGFGKAVGSAVLGAVDKVTKPVRDAIGKIGGFGKQKGTASLEAEKKKVDSIVSAALRTLRDFVRRKWEVKISADASSVARARDAANRYLGQIRDEMVYINVKKRRRGERGGFMGAFAAGGVADMAHGGPVPGAPLGAPAADGRGNADVAPGEAVLTGHHQEPVQRAMAYAKAMGQGAYGSLEEMFAKVKTRHSVPAGGGHAGAFHSGGGSHIAEDGSMVPASFYDRPAFAQGGPVRGRPLSPEARLARSRKRRESLARRDYDRSDQESQADYQRTSSRAEGKYRHARDYQRSDTYKGLKARRAAAWIRNNLRYVNRLVGRADQDEDENATGSVSLAERTFSMWQSRYDLTEEEFVRNGALSPPDINRRARELDSLIGKARAIMGAMNRRAAKGRDNLYWIGRGNNALRKAYRNADAGVDTSDLRSRGEELRGAAKTWGDTVRLTPYDLFESKTGLMELQNERNRLHPNGWPALLAAAGGGGGGGAAGDDGRMQREIERLTAALQSSRGLAVFGGANDIGAGGRPGLLALRHGGVVPGTGPPDSRLALVSPGERWSTPQANEQFGGVYDALERAAGRQGLSASRRGGGGEGPGMSFEPLQPLTDGRTLGLLSGAVTAGMARQGHRTSTRERTGL